MKPKARPKTIPEDATVQDVVTRLEGEGTLLKEQRAEVEKLLKALNRSTKWATSTDEIWENLLSTIESVIADIDNNILYVATQLAVLKKAVAAFEADDPEAIKEAARAYLLSDISISLKNLALQRYDNSEIIKSLSEYEAN